MQPLSRVPFALHVPFPLDLAHDPDVDAGLDALRNQPQHRVVAHPRVVNQELFARAADEPPETLARVLGADHETRVTWDIRPAVEVSHEQLGGFVHELLIPADDAEAAARRDVEAGEIEAVDVKEPAVDDHHLPVVPHEIVGGPRDGDARLDEAHLEPAKAPGPAAVGVRCQRAHPDAASHRRLEGLRDLGPIEPENHNVDALLRLLDGGHDGGDSGVGLNNEFHGCDPQLSR